MKRLVQQILHYVTLLAVTIMAAAVMWWVSSRSTDPVLAKQDQYATSLPALARPRALVSSELIQAKDIELISTFTGKIRPWETYSLGFEVAGRVIRLGTNEKDEPLDDGMHVMKNQRLAALDDRIFLARKSETAAQLEEATSDLKRARRLREKSPGAITESEFQEHLTEVALARAQHDIALKNLDDAVLTSPVDATISRRLINVGESVSIGQIVFELVQDDDVLLVVDVPESQVRELEMRKRAIEQFAQEASSESNHDEQPSQDSVFRAYITLEGPDRFGHRIPPLLGEVYRIAQVADQRTGLFEVEIRVPNHDHLLRAGMVASARIVTDHLHGYEIPETAITFRGREAFLFTLDEQSLPLQMMFWEVGKIRVHQARRVQLSRWIDQGPNVVVPTETVELKNIVVRGHQRLADGQLVRIVDGQDDPIVQARGGLRTSPAAN